MSNIPTSHNKADKAEFGGWQDLSPYNYACLPY